MRRDALLLAEQRDPFGHLLHVLTCMAALFLAPLGVVPAEVGFWLLVAVSILRSWTLIPAWAGVLRWPCAKWLVALVALAAISLSWSSDPEDGLARLKFIRAALWAFLLWPVLGDPWARPRLLVALLAGICVLAGSQIVGSLLSSPPMHAANGLGLGGLHGDPAKAALWCAAGSCIAAGLVAQTRHTRPGVACLVALALIALAGVVLSGSLRVIGATCAAFVVCSAAAGIASAHRRRWSIVAALGAATLAGGTWLMAPDLVSRARAALQSPLAAEGSAGVAAPVPNDLQLRAFWWHAEWEGFLARPILGWGWGSTPTIVSSAPGHEQFVERYPGILASRPDALRPQQPHSLYMMCLGELGIIGTGLLMMTLLSVLKGSIEAVRTSTVYAGVLTALAMWLIAAAGDTVTNSNALSLGTMLVTMVMAPEPVRRRSRSELTAATQGKIRVALFVEKFGVPGGSERFAQETVLRLADSGQFEFHVFANRWSCDRSDIAFYRVPMVRFPRPLRPWLFVHLAKRMIDRGQFDVVHSHHAYPGADLVSLHGTPRRFWVEEIQYRRVGLFDRVCDSVDRATFHDADRTRFMPVSSLVTQTYRHALGPLPGRWTVVHPGVDNARFDRNGHTRAAARRRLGIEDDELTLLFVGLNYDIKGLQLAMDAVALATPQLPSGRARLLVVGRGDEARYMAHARSLGIEDQVTFVGVVESGLETYYHAADAFIMLSVYETFCMAAFDAMAARLPVIITDRMGICDLVRDGTHGFVVPRDCSAAQVAERILLLTDPGLRAELGERGRSVAEAHEWSMVADRLAAAYRDVARSRQL
jgi:UDP-glucose:(heptosyl)LPS alpha-1,3-glucosyltransferase